VTEFSVAVNQGRRDPQTGEWSDETDWFRVTVWGDRGEMAAERLRKGTRVFVEGRFKTREYQTRDGEKRVSMEVTADSVIDLTPRDKDEAPARPQQQQRSRPVDDDLDDLPF
jgi:single-strand DNA-binding protein